MTLPPHDWDTAEHRRRIHAAADGYVQAHCAGNQALAAWHRRTLQVLVKAAAVRRASLTPQHRAVMQRWHRRQAARG